MNTIKKFLLKAGLSWVSIFAFIFVVQVGYSQEEIFKLGVKEYRLVDGRWYNFSAGQKGDPIVPDRLIVRLKDRGDLRQFDFARVGLQNLEVISDELFGGYFVVKVNIPRNPFAVASALARNPLFDYVEFDALGEYHGTPNDPLYPNQWNMPKISMPSAWDITTGSSSVILAIIDSGTDYNHEDLDGNLWRNISEVNGQTGIDDDNNGYIDDFYGWDFYDNDNTPLGVLGHGTAVAGIAAAQTNNYESGSYRGVAGVAGGWGNSAGAGIMILRINDRNNSIFISSAMQCIRYAARNGSRVMNMSFGWEYDYQYVREAIDSAANVYGCVLVASAGNNGGNGSSDKSIRHPAKYSTTIAVGATVQDDSRWVTSGYWGSAIGPELDVMAPGGASIIWTTDISGSGGYNSGDYMSDFGGTSASAPHVAGLAALIRSVNPSLTWQQVRDIIRNSAHKVSGMGHQNFTNEYGYGRINALGAVFRALTPPTIVGLESAPAGVKIIANPMPFATSYDANKSPSSGGPFRTHATGISIPAYVSTAWLDIRQPPPYPWVVDTAPYYWTVNGRIGDGITGTPSASAGPVQAWPMRVSSSSTATKNNNQPKIAKGSLHHVIVFQSNGDIFFTRSVNESMTWLRQDLVSQGDGRYSNPSVEDLYYAGGMQGWNESYVVWEENPVGTNGYRIWARRRNNVNNTWGPIYLLHENLSNRPLAAQPVVSGLFVFWSGPSGILWRDVVQEYSSGVYDVPGTDANSRSPSVDLYWNYINEGIAHIAWEQTGAGIRYRSGYVNWNGASNWNPIYNIADNSGLTTNSKPTVVRDYTGNARIAWEYKFITNGNIKLRTVAPNGTLGSITTFPNPPGATRIPSGPSLTHYRSSGSDNLTITWHSPTDGIIGLYYRNGVWQNPFVVATSGQHVHVNNSYSYGDTLKLAMFMGTNGSPYPIHISTLPATTPLPLSPVLISPANGAMGVPVPVTFTWDYVIGASTYRLQIDDNNDFSSPVVDVSGLTAPGHSASLNTWTTYYWRVNAASPYGTSAWSTVWQFTTGDPLPPGCPFVYTWDGESFVEDNNILPQSEYPENEGRDVTDYYQLFTRPSLQEDRYRLAIGEFEQEHTFLDQVKLLVVDHHPDVAITVDDSGRTIQFAKPAVFLDAQLDSQQVLKLLYKLDNVKVEVTENDTMCLWFTNDGGNYEPGLLLIGQAAIKTLIAGKMLNKSEKQEASFTSFRFRRNPSYTWVLVPARDTSTLQIDIEWKQDAAVDYTELSRELELPFTVQTAQLLAAEHSMLGDVTEALRMWDEQYTELLPNEWIDLEFSAPPLTEGMERSFIFVSRGRYERLEAGAPKLSGLNNNNKQSTASTNEKTEIPTVFQLEQNYPNPFNPSTRIKFGLPERANVRILIYDVLGRIVRTLVNEELPAAFHEFVWDGRSDAGVHLPSGIYLYRFTAGTHIETRRMMLLK